MLRKVIVRRSQIRFNSHNSLTSSADEVQGRCRVVSAANNTILGSNGLLRGWWSKETDMRHLGVSSTEVNQKYRLGMGPIRLLTNGALN